jgi:predicted secreted Zn-dependent protease
VRGMTTEAIFDYLNRNGPTDETGERGTGLTSARWTYSWQGEAIRGLCLIGSMSIVLDITVVLPRHEQLNSLSPDLRQRWQTFAEGVQVHEQRHVDIHLQGAESIKSRMAALSPQSSCEALETLVADTWAGEQALIDSRQAQFHKEEDARLRTRRAPIEARLQSARRELNSVSAELQSLNRGIDAAKAEADTLQGQIASSKAQIEAILRDYPRVMPPQVYAQYQSLLQQNAGQVQRYNAVVDQHNSLVERRAPLQASLEKLDAEVDALVESYNWTR